MKSDNPQRIGGKPWLPPVGTPLGAMHWLRDDLPWVKDYLGLDEIRTCFTPGIAGTMAWGGRIGSKITKAIATARLLPHWRLEDGFLRSVGLGKSGSLPLSIVADDLGLSTDASVASRLERLIIEADDADAGLGASVREAIVHHGLSKYNHLPHDEPTFVGNGKRRVLLVDQVRGDVSVPRSLGSEESFETMLNDALASGAHCIVRTHPDVIAGYRRGYLTEMAAGKPGVTLSAEPVSAAAILKVVDEVWTVASQFGFDALLRGVPVRCYAAPFYSGWGLTEDRMSERARRIIAGRRTVTRSVDHLAAAAFVHYPIYRNPETWAVTDVFQTIDAIVAGRKLL
ncbi:capsular biosynthesis protein [Aliirhizobium terrae]|uniref:capsular polysaccharide export protein, LipB/KpsS family n=1 Tax=Terrirhizobium terrae TaxID=2926709 RepID=UPI002575023F|nr:capsular biosynthesis protein [Rhizobium sp. CC-CFT758]WJH40258.1 capsular biosynthesis protein [Rhizobium sp. CC-CFT758]